LQRCVKYRALLSAGRKKKKELCVAMALEPAEIQMGDINVMDNKDMRVDGSTSFQAPAPATPVVTTYTSPSGSNKRSWVWAHFIEIENGTSVKCTVPKRGGEPCGRVLKKDKTGSTKSMHEHLMALHKLGDPQKRARTEASIDKYLSKNAKSIPHVSLCLFSFGSCLFCSLSPVLSPFSPPIWYPACSELGPVMATVRAPGSLWCGWPRWDPRAASRPRSARVMRRTGTQPVPVPRPTAAPVLRSARDSDQTERD
jgi:hypothetical protein